MANPLVALTPARRGSMFISNRWIRDGRDMARREAEGAFESIDLKCEAETTSAQVAVQRLKARGGRALGELRQLEEALIAMQVDPARCRGEMASGRADLAWAIGLTILNAVLAVLVLSFASGPIWMTALLAFLVLVSALPIEEFFTAHQEKAALREGLFLVLSVLALTASFWLGSLRGLFMMSEYGDNVGPANDALRSAGLVLRYTLGVLAVVSETLCGWKWFRVRQQLFAPHIRATKRRDRLTQTLVNLHGAMKQKEAEPGIRREYRKIGARQYLAEAKRPASDAERSHLERAVMGAVIALVVLGILFWAVSASAEPAAHTKVVLIDLSKSSPAVALKANVEIVTDLVNRLPVNSRIVVLGITDAFGNPQMLLDKRLSDSGRMGLQLRAAREHVAAAWRSSAEHLAPTYLNTSIIGTISLIPYIVGVGSTYDLLVLSDGRENVHVNIDRMPLINVPRVIGELRIRNSIPKLLNVNVSMLGVDPSGKTPAYFETLREFWRAFFQAGGARLVAFRIDRTLES